MIDHNTEPHPQLPHRPHLWPGSIYVIVAASLIGMTAVRIATTYRTFTGTYDEPFHIASGMEWLDKGTYSYELQHPPLARVAMAVGPYLKGLRSHSLATATDEGNAILQTHGTYQQNLLLARLGNLPFLLLACVVILLWARRWFTAAGGLWALLLFLSLPSILGHAGLATLDMACAATLLAALYHLMRWLETPLWWQSFSLGTALSLAFLTKFSNIAYVAVCCAAATAYWVVATRDRRQVYRQLKLRIRPACITAGVLLVLLWAGYRFSLAPISTSVGVHKSIDQRFVAHSWMRRAAYKALETPIPLTPFVQGIREVYTHNKSGHDSYLFGKYRMNGWWYFFPVVLGLKTPLGFLLLAVVGILSALWRYRLTPWQHCLTALFPIALLLLCMTSRIDLGVRHILAIYPLLALMAGNAICDVFLTRRWRMLSALSLLVVCMVVAESWLAHPDYLAYFNQLAGGHPETFLAESDLDWGQDLHRLSLRLKVLGIKHIAIRYFGTAPLGSVDLPDYRLLCPDEKTTGYVAISVRFTTLEYAKSGAYGWLKRYKPLERIGKSIFLYCIEQ